MDDRYSRRDRNVQSERRNAKRDLDAHEWERTGEAEMDNIESAMPGFIRGSDDSDRRAADDKLPDKCGDG